MATNVTPHVTAYICCKEAARALDFYKQAFGATETMRLTEPGTGKIGHAEIKIGDTFVMLADEFPDFGAVSPKTLGGSPVKLHLRVGDSDAVVTQAVAAGAKVIRAVEDQFYGERSGTIEDPFGHQWMVSATKENVSAAEMQKRYDALMKK
ncbi:MAG: VOC family protein [Candidatus Binatia bacterium]